MTITLSGLISNALAADNGDSFANRIDITWTDDGQDYTAGKTVNGSIVEPDLVVTKNAPPSSSLQAGQEVTYTVFVTHSGSSAAPAFDVDMADLLPAEVTYSRGFDAPGASSSTAAGQVITAFFDEIPLGSGVTVTYVVGTNFSARAAGSIVNTAWISYTSMPGDNVDERNANATATTANDYSNSAARTVTMQPLVLSKYLVGTNQDHTNGSDIAVGEQITYSLLVTVAQGIADNVVITDLLDSGLGFVAMDSVDASTGVSWDGAATPTYGISGRQMVLDFGQVTNNNNDLDSTETITVTYRAVVLNANTNQKTTTLNNSATLTWDGGSDASFAPNVVVTEPKLTLIKTLYPDTAVQAYETVTVTLAVDQAEDSNADAMTVVLTDALPANMAFVPGSLVDVSGVVSSSAVYANGVVTFTWDRIDTGQGSVVQFQVATTGDTAPDITVQNTAHLSWSSLPGDVTANQAVLSSVGVERTGNVDDPGGVLNDYRTVAADSLTTTSIVNFNKHVTGTDQPHTAAFDVAVGEQITYTISFVVPQGTTRNVVIADILDDGLAFVNVDDIAASPTVTWTTPVTRTIDGSSLALGLGTVVNSDGNVAATEIITITYRTVVLNSNANQRGAVLDNAASLTWDGGSSSTNAEDLTIVEPTLSLAKTVSPGSGDAGDVFTYTLAVTHTAPSDADAHTIIVTDVLPAGMTYVGVAGRRERHRGDRPDPRRRRHHRHLGQPRAGDRQHRPLPHHSRRRRCAQHLTGQRGHAALEQPAL
ncbi:MAG: isopeptide-forming domain-containing fimbrial protein [Caldilineaceae bacterium]